MSDQPAPRPGGEPADDTMAIIAAVSHELRSPLTSMKGFTALLLDRWDHLADADKREFVMQIDHDASRVARMVAELLDISRIESGRLTLRREPVDLARLAALVAPRVALVHPRLRCTVEPTAAAPVPADRDKLEQVLTNLFENGAKYATPPELVVRITDHGHRVDLSVEDRGPGIPDGELDLVFSRFFRGAAAQPSGTGLGLWISRALVEAHGGTLVARRNAAGGTTFCLTLPREGPSSGAA